SVAVGPFNYQVCTSGEFSTKIHLKNFTLAQLGLIGLVLRDLNDGWFGLGFAKSRGMGTVQVKLNKAVVQYPGCVLEQDKIKILGSNKKSWELNQLLGVKQFLSEDSNSYEFPSEEPENVDAVTEVMDLGLGVQLTFHEGKVKQLFIAGVKAWKKIVEGK
ncbi:MAG: CRISPR-associated protein, partial [Planktothrix sp.]